MEIDKPITTAIFLFLSLVAIFYLAMPKYNIYSDLLKQISTEEARYRGQDKYYADISKNYNQLMQYKENLAKIDDAIPSKSSFNLLLNLLYESGASSGIVIQNVSGVSNQQAGSGESIKDVNLSLSLFGSYSSLKNFIDSLEKSARLIENQNFNFSVTQPSKQNPNPQGSFPIKLDIKARSY